uniref:RING-type domain-containing protein n=1 Tax=Anopheles dirus TaxID=7168 RepID=A0A182NI94_9DIPT
MNLVCPICSELFVPSDEVNITPCGHMFHHTCLLQWLERSKTCPQCRNRCTEVRLIKVYFNVTANLDTTEDSASLLEKLDNLTLKMRQQEKSLKEFETKAVEHKGEQKKMRKTLLGLEDELRAKHSAIFAYKHEIDMLKGDRKALVKVQEELNSAKTKLESYAGVKQALDATAHEMEQMLSSDMSREAVIALATTLKRELQAQEIKRIEQSDRLKRLQNELVDERRKRKTLEENLSTCDSEIHRLEQLLKQQNKEPAAINTSAESMSPEMVPNTPDQGPYGGRKRPAPRDLNKSTPVSEKVRKILSATSPYLRVKTSSIGLAPLMRGGLSAHPLPAGNIASKGDRPKPSENPTTKLSILSNYRVSGARTGFSSKSTALRTNLASDENNVEGYVAEENAPRYTLTSSTVTARLKAGKLTRHPSTVTSTIPGVSVIVDLDLNDVIE